MRTRLGSILLSLRPALDRAGAGRYEFADGVCARHSAALARRVLLADAAVGVLARADARADVVDDVRDAGAAGVDVRCLRAGADPARSAVLLGGADLARFRPRRGARSQEELFCAGALVLRLPDRHRGLQPAA